VTFEVWLTTIVQDPTPVQSPENAVALEDDVSVTVVPLGNGAVHVPETVPYGPPSEQEIPVGALATEKATGAVQYRVQ
jgi:hypothetical protein